MAIHEKLAALEGQWSGTNRLNLAYLPDPIKESASSATVRLRAGGTCLEIAYTWVYEGEPHDGFIVISTNDKGEVKAAWTDSWHSTNELMACTGRANENGSISVNGHYQVEGHPQWGWRTEVVPQEDKFKYLMFNVSPEGHEEWAVETVFSRT